MNKKSTFFAQSVGIAINRSATQIASIAITAMLGLLSTEILAEFSLALSFAAILFVLVTTIQMGIQSEFGRLFAEQNFKNLWNVFNSVVIVVFILSCALAGATWLLPNPFSSAASIALSENAYKALKILALSLPLVGLLTTITFFLESTEQIVKVARLRTTQIVVQIGFVFMVILGTKLNIINFELTSATIAAAYVLSDIIMLMIGGALLFFSIKKEPRFYFKRNKNILSRLNIHLDVLRLGFPVMFGMLGQRFIFYCYANLAASIGVVQASAFSIASSCVYFFQIPILGVAHLMTIKISQARGEKNSTKLESAFSACRKLFFVEIIAIGFCLLAFQPFILKMFTNDIQVLQSLSLLQWIIPIYFLMNASLTFSMSSLRGYSDTLVPQIILITLLAIAVFVCHFSDQLDLWNILLIFCVSGFVASYFLIMRMLKLRREELLNIGIEVKTTA